jgi:hypothetical protein
MNGEDAVATALGAAIGAGAATVAAQKLGSRRGGAAASTPGSVVPARMRAHMPCLRQGQGRCGRNAVGEDKAPGADPSRCPLRHPDEYGMTRAEVERIADKMEKAAREGGDRLR